MTNPESTLSKKSDPLAANEKSVSCFPQVVGEQVRKSEIEVADFDRLLSKIEFLDLSQPMREMLIRIKDSGMAQESYRGIRA